MAAHKAMYPTLDAYYAADERRLRSEEADYGVRWRLDGWEYRWRVSYVRNTGEIYAVNQGCTIGPVFVLARAVRPSDSLRWVRDRLASVDVTLLVDRSETVPAGVYAAGRCLGCGCWIEAATADEWRLRVRAPCPNCGRPGW